MKILPVRGTHDIFGKNLLSYRKAIETIKKLAFGYGYDEIITPVFESSDLFKKPLGEQSDVVLKEMYTFEDKNKSYLTLRPEYTTPIIRAAISNNLLDQIPRKVFGIGPMFRRERPQKGRYRQFHQMNFEILGSNDTFADVELIILSKQILTSLFPSKKFEIQINSLGDRDTLKLFKSKLSSYFEKYSSNLSEESQKKIHSNPLRILDSKNNKDIKISHDAPVIENFYSKTSTKKFEEVKTMLDNVNVEFVINKTLVRGLDYYCQTVFEIKTKDLGSQDTLIGGGRYDGLIKKIGGPDLPGIGFAGGIDRIVMLMQNQNIDNNIIQMIILDEKVKNYGMNLFKKLQENKIPVFWDYKHNIKKSLSLANKINLSYAIIIGENEYKKNDYILKNLKQNTQKNVNIGDLIKELKKINEKN